MTKLLLLTTAVGLALGSTAFAQTTVDPSKIEGNKPVAQADKPKPLSRIEKWQADKRAEEERERRLSTSAKSSSPQSGTPTTPSPQPSLSTSNSAQAQMPASNAGQTIQGQASASGASTNPSSSQTSTNVLQPNTQAAAAPVRSTVLSTGVSVTDPQRSRISESFARTNIKALTGVDFSVSIGSKVPREIRLHTLPSDVVEIVPQYRDYRFLKVRTEIVVVDPTTNKIVTILPNDSATAAFASASTSEPTSPQSPQRIADQTWPSTKKASSRSQRKMVKRHDRDDAQARTEVRMELRVGQRVPDGVVLHEIPPTGREATALREYATPRDMTGARTRTMVERID